jgi:hypothetical protein
MSEQKKFYRTFYRVFFSWLTLGLLSACLAWTQAPSTPASAPGPAQKPSATGAQPKTESDKSKPSASQDKATPPSSDETHISPQEAEELFHSVDEILKFASQDSALPIHEPVKRRLVSRDEVVAYIEKHMSEDEDAQRLKRSELVLKKFGLLPRDFDLGKFLIALLREQVAGYYDPSTKTVNLLDWVEAEQQKPVLAHELTHALQDQSFGLEKWMKAGVTDLALSKREPTPQDIEEDEVQDARQAVIEGQAMAVLIDYMLAPTGQSLVSSPQLVEALKQGMLVGTADSVQFRNAPVFLQEVLTFPYRYGIDFVGQVLMKSGKDRAFSGAFKNPPHTTRQIMQPLTYLSGERIEPMPLPDFARLMKNYERFDVGSMGEFDVALLVNQFAGTDASHHLYPEWRGGYYYAARPKGDPDAPLALLYVSRWAAPESAAEFAAIYYGSLHKRYHSVRAVAPPGKTAETLPPTIQSLTGNHEWLTEDGDVVIGVQGDTVFVSESLDDITSDNLRAATFAKGKAAGAGK